MQKIKVVKVEQKPTKTGGVMVAIYDEKNTRFSGFETGLQEIKAGDIINAEIEVDGKFNNIKSFTLIEHGIPSAVPAEVQALASDTRAESIEQQVAIKAVVELLIAGIIEPDNLLGRAALLWMAKRLDVNLVIEPESSPQPLTAVGRPAIAEPNGNLPIDLDWLTESLEKIHYKKATLVSWLRSKANYQELDLTGEIEDIIGRMNKEQADFLVKHIQSLLEVA